MKGLLPWTSYGTDLETSPSYDQHCYGSALLYYTGDARIDILATLGPQVYEYCLHGAIWIPRAIVDKTDWRFVIHLPFSCCRVQGLRLPPSILLPPGSPLLEVI